MADFGVAIAAIFTGAAEGDVLQDGDFVFDHGGFTDDDADAVIEEDGAAEAGGGVDIDGEAF